MSPAFQVAEECARSVCAKVVQTSGLPNEIQIGVPVLPPQSSPADTPKTMERRKKRKQRRRSLAAANADLRIGENEAENVLLDSTSDSDSGNAIDAYEADRELEDRAHKAWDVAQITKQARPRQHLAWEGNVVKQLHEAMQTGRTLYGSPIKNAYDFFAAIDVDNSGTVDEAELVDALRRLDIKFLKL
eukprot:SAG31_NODE_4868_length_2899_cov_1.641071_3_plen_188_part_00